MQGNALLIAGLLIFDGWMVVSASGSLLSIHCLDVGQLHAHFLLLSLYQHPINITTASIHSCQSGMLFLWTEYCAVLCIYYMCVKHAQRIQLSVQTLNVVYFLHISAHCSGYRTFPAEYIPPGLFLSFFFCWKCDTFSFTVVCCCAFCTWCLGRVIHTLTW